mmetsp:Transcript_19460/g.28849  ORF Transcript_19460/g.28849 Transcript_19460/m.28849 type:complete len:95 (-) Transcript_19460:171-455(-)|eukprot:CAMPEP_0194222290 /NCGR_PEP_ID=MMETSP0156-20130528/32574_1 /TAXON_ID=33649 /ORGANISM="Thalassionema nitzschioides, Strain L26-B" /LENGTH=94 /DNA_ID=CAMNT_0038953017 /DNA_START=577 /DNA_END=861 /DNA_ORIENTATION=+
MDSDIASAGNRSARVTGLDPLKCPKEGGTKKEYEDFMTKIDHHVTIGWRFGKDIGHVVKEGEMPDIEEPKDLEAGLSDTSWKKLVWEKDVTNIR